MAATQQGVDNEVEKDQRTQELDDLTRQQRERRDQELSDEGFTPEDTSTPVVAAPADDPDAPGGKNQAYELQSGETDPDTPTDEMVTLKVDGEEKQVPMSEVVEAGRRTMQKESFADKRLQEATDLLKEAKEARQVPSNQPPGPGPGVGAPSPGTPPPNFDAAELARAIQYGSEEEATAAVVKMTSLGASATQMQNLPQEQLGPFIQDTIAFNEAGKKLEEPVDQGGYSDLWTDPTMQQLFIRKEQEVRARLKEAGEPMPPYKELYAGIAGELRKWRDTISQPTSTTTSLDDKRARKAGSDTPPVAGGRMPANNAGAGRPKSRQEVLAAMAESRHQEY